LVNSLDDEFCVRCGADGKAALRPAGDGETVPLDTESPRPLRLRHKVNRSGTIHTFSSHSVRDRILGAMFAAFGAVCFYGVDILPVIDHAFTWGFGMLAANAFGLLMFLWGARALRGLGVQVGRGS